jgi:hypothetical protein
VPRNQTIGQDPYSATQIINVAIWILMQLGIFPIKEFETWVAVPNKTYPLLKTFIHEAYMRRLTAITLRNTARLLGYVANQNMFNMFCNNNPNEQSTDDNAMMVTQKAAVATTRTSTLGSTYAATTSAAIPPDVTMAMKQLSVNQTAIMQQMAVMSFSPPQLNTAPFTCHPFTTLKSQCSRQVGFNKDMVGHGAIFMAAGDMDATAEVVGNSVPHSQITFTMQAARHPFLARCSPMWLAFPSFQEPWRLMEDVHLRDPDVALNFQTQLNNLQIRMSVSHVGSTLRMSTH